MLTLDVCQLRLNRKETWTASYLRRIGVGGAQPLDPLYVVTKEVHLDRVEIECLRASGSVGKGCCETLNSLRGRYFPGSGLRACPILPASFSTFARLVLGLSFAGLEVRASDICEVAELVAQHRCRVI